MYRNLPNLLHFWPENGKMESQITRKDFHLWNFCDFWKAFAHPLVMR